MGHLGINPKVCSMPVLKKKWRTPAPVAPALAPSISITPAFLSVEHEAGKYLGVSEWTIRRLIKLGKLPAKKIGRRLIVKRSDLDAVWECEPVFSSGKKKTKAA
jgi:excisionase family DNA binding protein